MRNYNTSFDSLSASRVRSPRTICATSGPCCSSNFLRGRQSGDLTDVEDEIVLAQPLGVWLDQRRRSPLQPLLCHPRRERGEIYIPYPAAGQPHQRLPVQ